MRAPPAENRAPETPSSATERRARWVVPHHHERGVVRHCDVGLVEVVEARVVGVQRLPHRLAGAVEALGAYVDAFAAVRRVVPHHDEGAARAHRHPCSQGCRAVAVVARQLELGARRGPRAVEPAGVEMVPTHSVAVPAGLLGEHRELPGDDELALTIHGGRRRRTVGAGVVVTWIWRPRRLPRRSKAWPKKPSPAPLYSHNTTNSPPAPIATEESCAPLATRITSPNCAWLAAAAPGQVTRPQPIRRMIQALIAPHGRRLAVISRPSISI